MKNAASHLIVYAGGTVCFYAHRNSYPPYWNELGWNDIELVMDKLGFAHELILNGESITIGNTQPFSPATQNFLNVASMWGAGGTYDGSVDYFYIYGGSSKAAALANPQAIYDFDNSYANFINPINDFSAQGTGNLFEPIINNKADYAYSRGGVRLVLDDQNPWAEVMTVGELSTIEVAPVSAALYARDPSANVYSSHEYFESNYEVADFWIPLNMNVLHYYSEDSVGNKEPTRHLQIFPFIGFNVYGEKFQEGAILNSTLTTEITGIEDNAYIASQTPNFSFTPVKSFPQGAGDYYMEIVNPDGLDSPPVIFPLGSEPGRKPVFEENFYHRRFGDLWGQGSWQQLDSDDISTVSPVVTGTSSFKYCNTQVETGLPTVTRQLASYPIPPFPRKVILKAEFVVPITALSADGKAVFVYSVDRAFSDELDYLVAFSVEVDSGEVYVMPFTSSDIDASARKLLTVDNQHSVSITYDTLTWEVVEGKLDNLDVSEWEGLVPPHPLGQRPQWLLFGVTEGQDTSFEVQWRTLTIFEGLDAVGHHPPEDYVFHVNFESFEDFISGNQLSGEGYYGTFVDSSIITSPSGDYENPYVTDEEHCCEFNSIVVPRLFLIC